MLSIYLFFFFDCLDTYAPSVSSLDSDIATVKELKYNPELERMAKKWVEDVSGEQIKSFFEGIKSGVLLCR
jgi:hypothetical protein